MYDICRIFAPRNICAMTKELDTVSYAFMVELVDCPKKNAFPCRKGKPAMCRFGGGYYSFDEWKDYQQEMLSSMGGGQHLFFVLQEVFLKII